MSNIRVALVDDHTILRAGLRMLIESAGDMTVVGETAEGKEAEAMIAASSPDVAILDLGLPGTNTPAMIERLARDQPHVRVLVLTMHDEVPYLRSSLGAGAAGFLVKNAADTELLIAIRAVYRGRTFVDASLHARSLEAGALPATPPRLSARELEVLGVLAAGHSYDEASKRLSITPKTVETYRTRLGRKLGLQTRAALVDYALRTGLLTRPTDAPPIG